MIKQSMMLIFINNFLLFIKIWKNLIKLACKQHNIKNDLFNETLIKKYSAKFKFTHKQKENVREYVEMIEKEEFKDLN